MRLIPLTKGQYAKVDDDWYEVLCQANWHAVKMGTRYYAARAVYPDARRKHLVKRVIYMHRLIGNPQPGQVVDHKNGDTLDNTTANLRPCTSAQNTTAGRHRAGGSGYRGVVYLEHDRGLYRAGVYVAGRYLRIGLFRDPVEAARAYNEAATRHHGEFARLNDLPEAA